MGGITETTPKPMLTVEGRPMLEHILDRLAEAGIREFLIVVGYHRELIEDYFRTWRLPIHFQVQDPVNGTGSAALLAKEFVGMNSFLLTYGDILCDAEEYLRCRQVLDSSPDTAVALAVKAVDDPWQGAAVYEANGRIERIVEKPPKGTSGTPWNSAGFYAFRPVVFEYLARVKPSPRNEYELTSAIDMMIADGLDLRIAPIAGAWRDVGRPEDLAAVNNRG